MVDEDQEYGSTPEKGYKKPVTSWKQVFGQVFLAMFIAEWGDRTQIAMVGQHASLPLIPVCLGSLLAFLILTCSAVFTGMLIADMKLREKTVHLLSSISFGIFTLLAAYEGGVASGVS